MKQNFVTFLTVLFIGFLVSSHLTCAAARLLASDSKTQIISDAAEASNINEVVEADGVDFSDLTGSEEFDKKYEESTKGRMVAELDAHVDYIYSQKQRNR